MADTQTKDSGGLIQNERLNGDQALTFKGLHDPDQLKGLKPLSEIVLGTDDKGKPIKFEPTVDHDGVQIKITGTGLMDAFAVSKEDRGLIPFVAGKRTTDTSHASAISLNELFGPTAKIEGHASKGDQEAHILAGGIFAQGLKVNEFLGGGQDQYITIRDLNPATIANIEGNVDVIQKLAARDTESASQAFDALNRVPNEDLGTSDKTKISFIKGANDKIDSLAAMETGPGNAKSPHFKAESGKIVAYLDDTQTGNFEKVLQSKSQDKIFDTGMITYAKGADGKGVVTIKDTSVDAETMDKALKHLKIAVDSGRADLIDKFDNANTFQRIDDAKKGLGGLLHIGQMDDIATGSSVKPASFVKAPEPEQQGLALPKSRQVA